VVTSPTSAPSSASLAPTAFVAELHSRWEQQHARWEQQRAARLPQDRWRQPRPVVPGEPSIFISYMREDAVAARRLANAIERLGGDVWLDEKRLRPGDAWQRETLTAIRHTIRLFVPIMSENTEREDEGYVFQEWREAVDRARGIPSRRFIVPVIIDEDYQGDPSRFRHFQDDFGRFNFGRAPAGEPDAALCETMTDEIRAMRRTDAP